MKLFLVIPVLKVQNRNNFKLLLAIYWPWSIISLYTEEVFFWKYINVSSAENSEVPSTFFRVKKNLFVLDLHWTTKLLVAKNFYAESLAFVFFLNSNSLFVMLANELMPSHSNYVWDIPAFRRAWCAFSHTFFFFKGFRVVCLSVGFAWIQSTLFFFSFTKIINQTLMEPGINYKFLG